MADPARVVIADDIEMILRGLEALLARTGIEIAGTAKNGQELVEVVAAVKPGVVITDIQMPVMDGIEATRQIKQRQPETGIIGLTMYEEDRLIVDMLKAGASGYLMKYSSMDELFEAVEAVQEGKVYYCNQTSMRLSKMIIEGEADSFKPASQADFSATELEIMRLICQEYVSKEIATHTSLTKNTVDKYRHRIMEKIGVKGIAGIVVYAIKKGIYRV